MNEYKVTVMRCIKRRNILYKNGEKQTLEDISCQIVENSHRNLVVKKSGAKFMIIV
jgi:hypothetical protein